MAKTKRKNPPPNPHHPSIHKAAKLTKFIESQKEAREDPDVSENEIVEKTVRELKSINPEETPKKEKGNKRDEERKQTAEEKLNSDERTIFVGNVDVLSENADVLSACGIPKSDVQTMRFRSIPVMTPHKCTGAIRREEKALKFVNKTKNCYIRFKKMDAVVAYLKKINELKKPIEIAGRPLRVNPAGGSGKYSVFDRKRTICVGGLHRRAGEKDLWDLGELVGTVRATRILRDKETFRTRRMGFIMFSTRDERKRSFDELKTKKLYGREIRIYPALDENQSKEGKKKKTARR